MIAQYISVDLHKKPIKAYFQVNPVSKNPV